MPNEYVPAKLIPLFAGEFVVDATAVEGLDERISAGGGAVLINELIDLRIPQDVAFWALTDNPNPIPAAKLVNAPSGGGGGGGGGLTPEQVDDRARAIVSDWAEVGNVDVIPAEKIPPIDEVELQTHLLANVSDWARAGNRAGIPSNKLYETDIAIYDNRTFSFMDAPLSTTAAIDNANIRAGWYEATVLPIGANVADGMQADASVLVRVKRDGRRYQYWYNEADGREFYRTWAENAAPGLFSEVGVGLTEGQVDARIVEGVADWAEAGNVDDIPDAKIPATIARTSQVSLPAEGWALVGNVEAIPAEKLTNAESGLSESEVDGRIAVWGRAGNTDAIPAEKLVNAPSGSGGGLTAEQVNQRIRAEVSDWAEANDNSIIPDNKIPASVARTSAIPTAPAEWAETGNVDDIPDSKIPSTIARAADIPSNADIDSIAAERVRAGVADWAEEGNTAQIPADKLGNAGAVSGGGLNAAAVDERIAAGVEDWAETGNTAPIPADKLVNAPTGGGGLDEAAVDARVAAGVADWAEQGNVDDIPSGKIPTDIARVSQIIDSRGLTNDIIDTRVADWAETGNDDTIPDNKIPLTIARTSGVAAVAAQAAQAVVSDWAEQGNNDLIPAAKLPVQQVEFVESQYDTFVLGGSTDALYRVNFNNYQFERV